MVSIYLKANQYDQSKLKTACEHVIDQHADILVSQKSLAQLPSECLKETISRDTFFIQENKILGLVNEWHVFHNQTEDLNIELIKQIRFQLIPNKELVRLANHSNLMNEKIVYQAMKEKLNTHNIQPNKRFFLQKATTKVANHNRTLVSGSLDKTIRIWDVDSGEYLRQISGHSDKVNSMLLLPHNQLASGSSDNSIIIWNVDSGAIVRKLFGHSKTVTSLQLLNDMHFASGSEDNTIKIWNIDSGE